VEYRVYVEKKQQTGSQEHPSAQNTSNGRITSNSKVPAAAAATPEAIFLNLRGPGIDSKE
jgi:hypothetical protein